MPKPGGGFQPVNTLNATQAEQHNPRRHQTRLLLHQQQGFGSRGSSGQGSTIQRQRSPKRPREGPDTLVMPNDEGSGDEDILAGHHAPVEYRTSKRKRRLPVNPNICFATSKNSDPDCISQDIRTVDKMLDSKPYAKWCQENEHSANPSVTGARGNDEPSKDFLSTRTLKLEGVSTQPAKRSTFWKRPIDPLQKLDSLQQDPSPADDDLFEQSSSPLLQTNRERHARPSNKERRVFGKRQLSSDQITMTERYNVSSVPSSHPKLEIGGYLYELSKIFSPKTNYRDQMDESTLSLDKERALLRLHHDNQDETIQIDSIMKVEASNSEYGRMFRMQLRSAVGGSLFWIYFELRNQDLTLLLRELERFQTIRMTPRSEGWLVGAMIKAQENSHQSKDAASIHHVDLDSGLYRANQSRRKVSAEDASLTADHQASGHSSRVKMSERLQGNPKNDSGEADGQHNSVHHIDPPPAISKRATRASSGSLTKSEIQSNAQSKHRKTDISNLNEAELLAARYGDFGPPWKKPLVYPRDGKKKATVDQKDLLRLDEGEFLNDNLIGFYLRYLMDQVEDSSPLDAKRIYWFNSYFFEKLTSQPKGKRGVNYEAVKRWTRDVDLFQYDFVIVPVNEAAHWYVIVICNLPQLFNSSSSKQEASDGTAISPLGHETVVESEEIIESTPPHASRGEIVDLMQDQDVRVQEADRRVPENAITTASMPNVVGPRNEYPETGRLENVWPGDKRQDSLSPPHPFDRESAIEATDPNDSGPMAASRIPKSPRISKKKKRFSVRLYDPMTPAIIALDSLGISHPNTTRAIKSYLVEEAKEKKGHLLFNESDIQGMNAKGIPQQDNFCDCGLYLLGYMDKFIENPSEFVSNLLQKSFDEQRDWPKLRPSQMRLMLQKLILSLHDEDVQQRKIRRKFLPRVSDTAEIKPDALKVAGMAPLDSRTMVEQKEPIARAALETVQSKLEVDTEMTDTAYAARSAQNAGRLGLEEAARATADEFIIPDSQNSEEIMPKPLNSFMVQSIGSSLSARERPIQELDTQTGDFRTQLEAAASERTPGDIILLDE